MQFSLPVALAVCFLMSNASVLLANGGAWQIGVPATGNAAPSDGKRATDVMIEEENLTLDLHYEHAEVEVRYRMHNTGGKTQQDFFFPVERWSAAGENEEGTEKPADLEGYRVTADGGELTWKNVPSAEKVKPVKDDHWGEFPPATKLWKKSEIPFEPDQRREIVVRYRVEYSGTGSGVSEDSRLTDQTLVYSLSPAATWKGAIGKGSVVVNVLHPLPEEVEIKKPKDRFKRTSDVRYEWIFKNLEPTLADDLKIIARRGEESYSRGNIGAEGDEQPLVEYVIQGRRYFLVHTDFNAVASSTLPPAGDRSYDVKNLKSYTGDVAWSEGVEGDGIGESINLDVNRALPLEAILIMPGYQHTENPSLWTKNNRVAEMEVTLNDEKTFTTKIPDYPYKNAYPLPVRDYPQPVKKVKLVIKAVHLGTAARDTCIASIRLKGKLAKKPEVTPAR